MKKTTLRLSINLKEIKSNLVLIEALKDSSGGNHHQGAYTQDVLSFLFWRLILRWSILIFKTA